MFFGAQRQKFSMMSAMVIARGYQLVTETPVNFGPYKRRSDKFRFTESEYVEPPFVRTEIDRRVGVELISPVEYMAPTPITRLQSGELVIVQAGVVARGWSAIALNAK